jgi:3-oxoacyl-[acyl-carrier protein] reductase
MSGQRLKGKVAIVTGASRGIGAAVAEHLAREGASVVVNYVDSAEKATAIVRRIEAGGSRAAAIQADVSKAADVQRLFDESVKQFGKVDILVNNAGVPLYKMVSEITEKEFDHILATNVKGVFLTCKQAARGMSDGGRIVNVSSSVTGLMLSTYVAYAATKGAVEQMTRHLAHELGRRGITVNAVSPGPTDTELFGEGKTEAHKQEFSRMAALGRLGEPTDIADVVTFLVTDDARWITGQNIRVNGGFI